MASIILGEAVEMGAAATPAGRATGKKLQRKARDLDGLARVIGRFIPEHAKGVR